MSDLEAVYDSLSRINKQLADIGQTLSWFFVVALFAGFFVYTKPDAEQSLAACEADGFVARSGKTQSMEYDRFLANCMLGHGFEYRHETPQCSAAWITSGFGGTITGDCFEDKGAWRTTKLKARALWGRISELRSRALDS
jgi:hypothetical protein